MAGKRILVLGDMHLPFLHKGCFTWVLDEILPQISKKNLSIIFQGDLRDQLAQKKFPGKIVDPQTEYLEATCMAQEIFSVLRKRCKGAKIWLLRGNHDSRAERKLYEKCPEVLALYEEKKDAYQFEGVETINDPKDSLIIDNTLYTHGHRTKLWPHLQDVQYKHNVVIGHLHTAEQVYERVGALRGAIRWAACAGYLADPFHHSDALNYRPMNQYFKWTHGVLLIEDQWPKFIGYEDLR